MKKRYVSIPVVSMFLMAAPLASASTYGTESVTTSSPVSVKMAIDSQLTVDKLSDGRISPVSNAQSLSEAQLNKVLAAMQVPFNELPIYSLDTKRQIVSRGGVAIPLETTKREHTYTALDGTTHVITDANRAEVQIIQDRDAATLKMQSGGITPFALGSVKDRLFTGSASIFYVGKNATATAFLYDFYSGYNWSGYPEFFLTDTIAQAWDSGISSMSSTGTHQWKKLPNDTTWQQQKITPVRAIGATKMNVDIGYNPAQYGAVSDRLEVPISMKGLHKQVISSYAHPVTGGIVSVALKYLSIEWSAFSGEKWNWDSTFTVSTTPTQG